MSKFTYQLEPGLSGDGKALVEEQLKYLGVSEIEPVDPKAGLPAGTYSAFMQRDFPLMQFQIISGIVASSVRRL